MSIKSPVYDGIAMYLGCKECGGRRPRVSVGVLPDGQTVRVWCDRHESVVKDFILAKPLTDLVCAGCGEPFGPGHHH